MLASAGRQPEAIEAGRAAVALEPNEWRHRFRLGVAAWGGERLSCFDDVVRLFPEFAYAYFGSAMVHVARRELDAAEEMLGRGSRCGSAARVRADRFPGNGLHWLLGLIRLAQGRSRSRPRRIRSRADLAGQRDVRRPSTPWTPMTAMALRASRPTMQRPLQSCLEERLTSIPMHARSLVGLAAARVASAVTGRRPRPRWATHGARSRNW